MLLAIAPGPWQLDAPAVASEAADETPGTKRTERQTAEERARERAEERAQEAVDAARSALRDAKTRARAAATAREAAASVSASAEGARRLAEEDVADALRERLDLGERRDAARARERAAARRVELLIELVDQSRDELVDRVREVYMYGSATARYGDQVLRLLAEAQSPGELGDGLRTLETVAADEQQRFRELEASLTDARDEQRAAAAMHERLRAAYDSASREVAGVELTAQDSRAGADGAEASLLSRWSELLAARDALVDASADLDDALAGRARIGRRDADATAPRSATSRRDGPSGPHGEEDDGGEGALAGRQRALARSRALSPTSRRARDDLACPVLGGRFANDWLFGRSNGRRHEGTDVFGPWGSPVRAVVDGGVLAIDTIDASNGSGRDLGGISVTYGTPDDRWYAAHLSRVADLRVGEQVEAGDVVGWVGNTGNARFTAPHLHIGWYVADVAVNPYASLAVACADAEPAEAAGQDAGPLTIPVALSRY